MTEATSCAQYVSAQLQDTCVVLVVRASSFAGDSRVM